MGLWEMQCDGGGVCGHRQLIDFLQRQGGRWRAVSLVFLVGSFSSPPNYHFVSPVWNDTSYSWMCRNFVDLGTLLFKYSHLASPQAYWDLVQLIKQDYKIAFNDDLSPLLFLLHLPTNHASIGSMKMNFGLVWAVAGPRSMMKIHLTPGQWTKLI